MSEFETATSVPVIAGQSADFSAPPELPARAFGYEPTTPWRPWPAIGASLLVLAACAFVIFIATIGILLVSPEGLKAVAAGQKLHLNDPNVTRLLMATMLLVQLVGTGLLLWLSGWFRGRTIDVLALHPPMGGWKAYAWAVPAFVLFGFGIGSVMEWLWPKVSQADIQVMMELTHSPAWWLMFLVAVIGAPLSEELMFRGFLFSALARSPLGLIGTTAVTSLTWAAIHGYSLQGFVTITALGVALSYILWRTGSTRVTMACHGVYNSLAFLAALLTPLAGVS